MKAIAFAILLLVSGGRGALAGTLIEAEARGLGSDPLPTRRGVMNLEADRMRLDVAEVSSAIIYRGDLELVWILDHRNRSFVRIDRATMEELSRRMAEAKAELRARLATLSPEQRASMEAVLGKTADPGSEKSVGISVRETGGTHRLNDVACAEVELRRGEEVIAVACTADWASAEIEPETFRPLQELGSLLRETLSVAPVLPGDSIRPVEFDALDAIHRLGGVPLRIQLFDDGAPIREIRATSIEQRSFAGEIFEIPADYQQKVVPFP
jgi:hypothetical protein